jgi:RHS repeat-associated protein
MTTEAEKRWSFAGESAVSRRRAWVRTVFCVAAAAVSAASVAWAQADDPPYKIIDIHVDHLGSTRMTTDADTLIISRHDFLPFGEEVAPMVDETTKMFTGHERDGETGLDYMFARYYGAAFARFVSVDPVSGRLGSGQSWNRYKYANSSPLVVVDPDGRIDEYKVPAIAAEILRMWRSYGGSAGPEHGFVIGHDSVAGGGEFIWTRPDLRFEGEVGLASAEDLWEGLGLVWWGGMHLHRKSSRASGGDMDFWRFNNEAVGRQIPDYADFYTIGPNGEVTVIRWAQDPKTGKWVIQQWVETTVEKLKGIAGEEDSEDDDGGDGEREGDGGYSDGDTDTDDTSSMRLLGWR